ncbi:MAG: hypothetical protein KatS3mg077_3257 [Candidatus Binatia bacterium]|nr:MAG: hypothetical protein KatS3mg077_3257 [Candidatus Binatia bacterium]
MRQEEKPEQAVLYALRRRGVQCQMGSRQGALLPATAREQKTLYDLLGHYSFRLFLRDLIRLRSGARYEELTHYCSLATVKRFVGVLEEMGLACVGKGKVQLSANSVRSFGPTLEWYVAEVLRREFGMQTAWNLRPLKMVAGGDYDVVAVADGVLVYVEVKSVAPRNIEAGQVQAFVRRVAALAPDVAIFLNDTQLRMLDKLVPAITEAARAELPALGSFRRLAGEIFVAHNRFFITNSEPSLAGNLEGCLASYWRTRAGF